MSCDFITDIKPQVLLNSHTLRGSSLTTLFYDGTKLEGSERTGKDNGP